METRLNIILTLLGISTFVTASAQLAFSRCANFGREVLAMAAVLQIV